MDAQTGLDLALEGRELDERWLGLCPPIYRETDIHRLPPEAAKVTQWQYGPRGLVVVGPTGVGKTRAMWLLLKRLVYEGRHVRALNAVEFATRRSCSWMTLERRGAPIARRLSCTLSWRGASLTGGRFWSRRISRVGPTSKEGRMTENGQQPQFAD